LIIFIIIGKYRILYILLIILYAIFMPKRFSEINYLISDIYKNREFFFNNFNPKN